MTVIELGLSKSGIYRYLFETPDTALLLARFLLADVGSSAKEFIKIFESNEDDGGAMNATQYTKDDGIVIITPEYIDEDESIKQGHFYSIQASILARLLRQWEVIYLQQSSYITIIIVDDKVSVIGSDRLIGEREGRALHLLEY